MKILLIYAPVDDNYKDVGKEFDYGWQQPLGIISIASYVKNILPESEILILDEQIVPFSLMKEKIKEIKPEWIGITSSFLSYKNSLELAGIGKKVGSKIVFGGAYATSLGKVILENREEVDYVVLEDGEKAMVDLLTNKPLNKISNLIWRRSDKKIIQNKIRFDSLDDLPIVDYSLVDLELYFNNYQNNDIEKEMIGQRYKRPIVYSAQKGCRWRDKSGGCLYCACIYPKWRGKSPEKVWGDIIKYKEDYKIDTICFVEDDFLSSNEWFNRFYDCRPEVRPDIRFIYARADSINEENVLKLKDLNCFMVYIGVESGVNENLRKMHKGVTVKRTLKAIKLLHDNGIQVVASFVLGAPDETRETLNITYEFAKKLKDYGVNHFTAYPFFPCPGSKGWHKIMNKSEEFRKLYKNNDILDFSNMISLWNKEFCQVSLMELLEISDKINNLQGTQFNSKAISNINNCNNFKSWGLSAIINLYGCDSEKIRDCKTAKEFVIALCKEIDMERHGDPQIERFAEGELEGISLMQFIKTSSITAHFDEEENRAFIDIFSCKYFDIFKAADFCEKFFEAKRRTLTVVERD